MGGEKPKEEILVSPQWTWLVFGDGYTALSNGGIEKKDIEGKDIIEFELKPTDALRKRYNIKESELNANRCITKTVYAEDIIVLNQFDDANRKWIYVKNYLGDETDLGKRDWILRKKIQELQTRIVILEGYMIFISEQLKLAKSSPMEFAAQGLEIFEKIASGTIEALKIKKEKEE